MVSFDWLGDGDLMIVGIFKNDTPLMAANAAHASHMDILSAEVVDRLYLDVGDSIQLKVWHSHGSNRAVYGNPFATYTYLSIFLT